MALERAMVAQVMDGYHYSPGTIARLTPAQIRRLCLHARDKDGSIRVPSDGPRRPKGAMPHVPPPATLGEATQRLERYYEALRLPAEDLARALERLRARWEGNGNADRAGGGGGDQ